ncbi:MAG TPA: methyltransferase [Lactovum miscens]|uniref:putative RNA methyltransferase n=1 Tax=Lactovum miscens TaxID=190387 RepID=UPI002ED8BF6B
MLKKIEKSRLLLDKYVTKLRCPICHSSFSLDNNALICKNHHTYNLSKKGTVNFLSTPADTEHYTRKMFEPRRRLIQGGMYRGLTSLIQRFLLGNSLLDVGTGEGSFLNQLVFDGPKFGFDIAKDGIEMATEFDMNCFLSLADLTNLPYADGSTSTILNILTPSNYSEFKRVLQTDGRLIKVIPGKFYLQELREAYGLAYYHNNSAVLSRFAKEFPNFLQKEIYYEFKIPEKLSEDFLDMSPLEWSVSGDLKERIKKNPPHTATIHLQVLITNNTKK